jgi:hypothetical protein
MHGCSRERPRLEPQLHLRMGRGGFAIAARKNCDLFVEFSSSTRQMLSRLEAMTKVMGDVNRSKIELAMRTDWGSRRVSGKRLVTTSQSRCSCLQKIGLRQRNKVLIHRRGSEQICPRALQRLADVLIIGLCCGVTRRTPPTCGPSMSW